MSERGGQSFSPRVVLALTVLGALLFLAFLWAIGSGISERETNDGGAHAGSKGLTGYAAMVEYLKRRGHPVNIARSQPGLNNDDLLILTPPHYLDGAKLAKLVEDRRYMGPTLIVTPKWTDIPLKTFKPGSKQGWVMISDPQVPAWKGFLDEVAVEVSPMAAKGRPARWQSHSETGKLPSAQDVLSGSGADLVPLVVGEGDGRILAAYVNDAGDYPALRDIAVGQAPDPKGYEEDEVDYEIHPIILVFEPDLLNNYGMADLGNAWLAERLVKAALGNHDGHDGVTFDVTLNGLGRSTNLLTLAFTPPFLAATICLVLAAIITLWRAMNRFGPPLAEARSLAFGKRALVENAAGLVRRARRLHLVGTPYADAARERLARALALSHRLDPAATEAAIDRALASRAPLAEPFSEVAARMRAARRPADLLRAAQTLHSLERTLTR